MPLNKLFPNELPDGDNLNLDNINTYYFSVIWNNPSANCALVLLQGSINGSNTIHNIITHPVAENDGEISVEIGRFQLGTNLRLSAIVQAISAIDNISMWVTNINTRQSIKVAPTDNTIKPLAQNAFWKQNIEIPLH